MRFLPIIKQGTDAVMNITTGGGRGMTVDERLAAPLQASPEMCSLNMGSMNFNISRAGDRITQWKHPWEKPYLARTDDFIFRNTFRDIARIVEDGQRPRHPLRVRVLRHRPSLQSRLHARPKDGRSRRSSCSPSSASSAASAPTSRT